MKKTSSRFRSPRCSSPVRTLAAVLAPVFLFSSGCASYVRIDAHDAMSASPRTGGEPRFCVVECILETHKSFAVFPGEKGGTSVQNVGDIHPAFQAASPDWFSSDTNTVPICVKFRADITDWNRPLRNPLLILPTLLTLGLVPSEERIWFDLRTSILLGPGAWSDGLAVSMKHDRMSVVQAALVPSRISPENGWRKEVGVHEPDSDDNAAAESPVMTTPVGKFNLMEDLAHADGPGGADPHFAKILANEIVRAWQRLSAEEKLRVRTNPVAAKLKMQLYPETTTNAPPPIIPIPVPGPTSPRPSQGVPTLVGYGYDKSSRQGRVEVAGNGAEHLAMLKWARTKAIPKIAGNGAFIRILSENTLENGNTRIEFEVVK